VAWLAGREKLTRRSRNQEFVVNRAACLVVGRAAAQSDARSRNPHRARRQLVIEHIEHKNFRKADHVAEVLQKRGDASGLVHVFSAMEACQAFTPWHDKTTGETGTAGKCLHY
jgi:hypothetical protein